MAPKKAAGTSEEDLSSPVGLASLVANTLYALTEKSGGVSIRQIAEATNNSRSSTHRILQNLARSGYVQQDETGRYVVGSRLLLLAARVLGAVPVLHVANSIMRDLVNEVRETCYLAVYSESDRLVTYVHRIESDHPVRFVQPLGVAMPLHAGAVGKAILAEFPEFDLHDIDMVRYTSNTPTTAKQLLAELDVVRGKGYATSVEERVIGVAGVAAAIHSGDRVLGALTVSIPTSRVEKGTLDKVGQTVRKHAAELSMALTSIGVERI